MRGKEEAFSKEKELRQALRLQADDGFCRACAPHLWQSHKGRFETTLSNDKK